MGGSVEYSDLPEGFKVKSAPSSQSSYGDIPEGFSVKNTENTAAPSEGFFDVLGRRASEAWDSRPERPPVPKNTAEFMQQAKAAPAGTMKALGAAGGIVSSPFAAAGENLEYRAAKAAGLPEEKSTKLAKDTGDVSGELVGLAPGIPGARIGSQLAKEAIGAGAESLASLPGKAGGGVRNAINSISDKAATTPTTSQALEKMSKASYDQAEKLGGVYTPKFANDLLAKGEKLAAREPQAEAIEGDTPLKSIIKDAQAWKDKPMTLHAAEQVDKVLTNKISMQYKAGNNAYARELENFQDEFRESMYNPSKEHAPQGSAGAAALKRATQQWAQMSRMRDLEAIVSRAETAANPAEAIKSGARSLYNNKKRLAGFTEDEKAAIKKVADGGPVYDAVKLFSSKLISIINAGTGGGIGTSSLAYGGTKLAGSAAEAIKMRQLENAKKLIANRKLSGVSADEALGSETEPLGIWIKK